MDATNKICLSDQDQFDRGEKCEKSRRFLTKISNTEGKAKLCYRNTIQF